MEEVEIQTLIQQAHQQAQQLSEKVSQLQAVISQLQDENQALKMTNEELKKLLVQRSQSESTERDDRPAQMQDPQTVSGHDRLEEFYNEGIHVCHTYFGTRRMPGEECIFCQGLLEGLANQTEQK